MKHDLRTRSPIRVLALAITGALLMAGCKGGSHGSGGSASTTATGAATKGTVQAADVRLYALESDGSLVQPALVSTTSDATDGTFDLGQLPSSPTGCYLLEVSGGTYHDEATDTDVVLGQGEALRAVFCPTSGQIELAVTPLTELATARALALASAGGDLRTAIESANQGVAQQFQLQSIIYQLAVDPSNATLVAAADLAARLYGAVLGGMSFLAQSLGARAIDLVEALAEDLSDGVFDGLAGSTPVLLPQIVGPAVSLSPSAGTSTLQNQINAFLASIHNATGLASGSKPITTTALQIGTGDPDALRVVGASPPPFVAGENESYSFEAEGGTPPYTWSVTSGAVPGGLSLSSSGELSGTASGSGLTFSSPFTVTVSDGQGEEASVVVILVIVPGPPTVVLLSVPNPQVGQAYDEPLLDVVPGSGAGGPYTFVVDPATGHAPLGMFINPFTGRLEGNPSFGGTHTFTACVYDVLGQEDCVEVTITVDGSGGNPGQGGSGRKVILSTMAGLGAAFAASVDGVTIPNNPIGVDVSPGTHTVTITDGSVGATWSVTVVGPGATITDDGGFTTTSSFPDVWSVIGGQTGTFTFTVN